MPLTVNTNIASLTAQRNLTGSQNMLSTSLERLSSGLRINSAKDDAAGLAISERFSAQIRGLNQGVRNANDGISLVQTAEGALGEVTNNLQRIRELAIQANNASNSSADVATLQAEVSQLVAEIDRVAGQTKFNNIALLDGSFTSKTFQIGANNGETISVASIVDARSTTLGSEVLTSDGSLVGGPLATSVGTSALAVNGLTAVTSGNSFVVTSADGGATGAIAYAGNSSAKQIATAITSAGDTAANGVSASASTTAYLSDLTTGATTFDLFYGGSSTNSVSISATVTDANDLGVLVNAINAQSATTGVIASQVTMSNDSGVGLKLVDSDGDNVGIAALTGQASGQIGSTIDETDAVAIGAAAGTDSNVVTGTLTLSSTKGAVSLSHGVGAVLDEIFATDLSSSSTLSAVNLSTDAAGAIDVIDAALDQVSAGRGDLGAYQNRFESVVASLQAASENLSASRSRIVDADFAAETAQLTKAQILQQSGIAMLAQANALPQNVLALLQ